MERSESIVDLVAQYLTEDEVSFLIRDDAPVIETRFTGESGQFLLTIYASDEPITILNLVVVLPTIIPPDERVRGAEAVTRANHSLRIGRFDLDFTDGELVFRAGLVIAESDVTPEQFRFLWIASCWTVDRYWSGFLRLLYGDDLSPAEAIAEVEMRVHESREQ